MSIQESPSHHHQGTAAYERDFMWECSHICPDPYCGPWTHDSVTEDCDLYLDKEGLCPCCEE